MLESEDAARRLGVKLSTLYAYVSRGLLESHPGPGTRRRLFAREDVERLAARARRGKEVDTRLVTVVTAVTQLGPGGPRYRGVPAGALAGTAAYEDVCARLWASPPGPFEAVDAGVAPAGMADADRLRWAVVACASRDRFRHDPRPESFTAAARATIATAVASLPLRAVRPAPALQLGTRRYPGSLAGRLCDRLAAGAATPGTVVEAVNAALVVMADHELATATVAARVAASARADLYGVLLAGLGTMGGRLHGGAPDRARALVDDAHRHGAGAALAGALATGGTVAGFGQPVYPEGDPRARWLLERAGRLTVPAERRTLDELTAVAAERGLPPPNADLGLAALAWAAHLVPDAAGTLFTVARFAGWVAHALEEQQERPLRYRARALYASRPAVSSVSLPPSGP